MENKIYSDLKTKIEGKRLVFCGIGQVFHSILRDLAGIHFEIAALLDNDTQKQGNISHCVKIGPFRSITKLDYDYIVLSTPFYSDIVDQLVQLGIEKDRLIRLRASYSFGGTLFETYAAQCQLTNRDFTLISDDCWGGILYSWIGLEFQSPFINLIVQPRDYLMLGADIDFFLSQRLLFHQEDQVTSYPIGSLDRIEIHFIHDKTQSGARLNWERRIRRINKQNIFFKFETDEAELIKAFDTLPLPRKILFTRNHGAEGASVIHLDDHGEEGSQLHRTCMTCRNHIDLVKWLNTGVAHPPSWQHLRHLRQCG